MKKLLLTLAAVSMAAGAWAQNEAQPVPEDYIDVTPSYYKFYKGETNLENFLRDEIKSDAQVNLGNTSLISKNTEGYTDEEGAENPNNKNWFTTDNLSKGNLIYRAGGYYTDAQPCPLKSAFSIYDFGGEVGSALIINGPNSNLDNAVKDALNLEITPVIPKIGNNFANFQLMWVTDYKSMNTNIPQGAKVRVKLEFNIYNNNMASAQVPLTQFLFQDEQANNPSGVLTPTVKINEFATEGKWDPTKWKVLEFECPYNRLASYVRTHMNFGSCGDMHNGAYLIRSLEIYGLPSAEYTSDYGPGKLYDTWSNYSLASTEPGGGGTTGVENIGADNAPVEYFNLQGVKIANPEKGIFIKKQGNKTTKVVL